MQITLQNLLDLADEPDAFEELQGVTLELVEDESGQHHLRYSRTCAAYTSTLSRLSTTVRDTRSKICSECAHQRSSLELARGGFTSDLVLAWVSARRWLSKPTRAGGQTQVRRTHQIEQALRVTRLFAGKAPWEDVLRADLEAMLPKLVGRIGSREDALTAAREVVARSVGGDAALLDETPMLLTLRAGYADVSEPTVEALRRQCALRTEQGFRVVALPAWAVTFLLRRGAAVTDFAPAGEDEALIHTAVALYSPSDEGPLGLLCSALATARNALAA